MDDMKCLCKAHSRAVASYGRKLKKLTSALVACAAMKHERLTLNNMRVEQGGGPVFENLDDWNDGFDAGIMILFDQMLTSTEREFNQLACHDAMTRFAAYGACPAPVFMALVFDKLRTLGVEDLGRFCDPDFGIAWKQDDKHYVMSMGKYASEHGHVTQGLLSGELEYVCTFGEKGSRKCLARSFSWDMFAWEGYSRPGKRDANFDRWRLEKSAAALKTMAGKE